MRTLPIVLAVLALGAGDAAAAVGTATRPSGGGAASPTTTYAPPGATNTSAPAAGGGGTTGAPAGTSVPQPSGTTPAITPTATATPSTPAATAPTASTPATSTPQAQTRGTLTLTQPGAGKANKAQGDSGLSTGAIVIAALAALLVLACVAWALARRRAFEPHWLLSLRHAMAEAGFRASATWSEFADWARLGR